MGTAFLNGSDIFIKAMWQFPFASSTGPVLLSSKYAHCRDELCQREMIREVYEKASFTPASSSVLVTK